MRTADVVYSADRIMRLRLVLLVVLVSSTVLGVLGIGIVVGGEADFRFLGVFAIVSSALLLAATGVTLSRLAGGTRTAKIGAIATGTLLTLIGVLLVTLIVGWLLILLGFAVLLLALLPDEPGAGR